MKLPRMRLEYLAGATRMGERPCIARNRAGRVDSSMVAVDGNSFREPFQRGDLAFQFGRIPAVVAVQKGDQLSAAVRNRPVHR